jgi:hypothetical protein
MWFPLLSLAFAADLVPVQGYATGADGAPLHGLHTIGFRLVRDQAGADLAWSGAQEVVFDRGVFSALVGGGSPALDYEVFAEPGALWVQLDIGGVLSDAAAIGRAPRAAHALWADSAASVGTIQAADVATQGDVSSLNVAVSAIDVALGALEDAVGALTTLADTTSNNLGALALDYGDRITELEGDVGGLAPGMIAFFPAACPVGWSEYTALRGRVPVGVNPATPIATGVGQTRGTALAALGGNLITDVPAHAHQVDPPATASGAESNDHTHTVDPPNTASGGHSADHTHNVDPPNVGTTTNGDHGHGFAGCFQGANGGLDDSNFSTIASGDGGACRGPGSYGSYVQSAGSHSHTLDIGGFNSGTTSTNHTHNVDIAPTASLGASATHTHSTNIAPFASATTGVAGVDVAMPYVQLVACQLD